MNTVKSFWYGWGALIVAGGGAYYFAKKSIDADRREKHLQRMDKERRKEALENKYNSETQNIEAPKYSATKPYQSQKGDRFS